MEGSYADKHTFFGEWYDNQASMLRRFYVSYHPTDNTIDIYDIKNKKVFMRRGQVHGITLDHFYIGCSLYIHGRLFKIVDFACEDTKRKLAKSMELIFIILKPQSNTICGKILTHLHDNGFRVTRMKKCRLAVDDVSYIYKDTSNDPSYPFLVEHMTNQMVYAVELVGSNTFDRIFTVIGARDPVKAEPGTIRALYGKDRVRNCLHASPSVKASLEALDYFFPTPPSTRLRLTATLSNCTLCLVKPHALREGKLGAALECIDEGGFDITALNLLTVENVNAAEFCEVYKGIVQEYKGMVEELCSGPCVAMEIVSKDRSQNTAVEFRKLVGPSDPEIARLLRPHTMRAKLGTHKIKNAIHCSDLPEDGLLEVEYFFKILVI